VDIDVKHKFIRGYAVTDAAVHDSQVFKELLDENNSSRDVYADSAYRSAESGFREHLQRKGCKNRKLTKWEQQGNRTRVRKRSRIAHVFVAQAIMARKSHSALYWHHTRPLKDQLAQPCFQNQPLYIAGNNRIGVPVIC